MAATSRRWRLPGALLLGLLLGTASSAPADPQPQLREYAVVAHPSTEASGVSLGTLRRIYLGEQQFWPEGRRIVIFIHPTGTPPRNAVLRTLYRMTERQYTQYWIARIFRDEASSSPRIVGSSELVKQLVAAVPGSIAVIPAGEVDPRLKVLRVDGRLPGAAGYPLAETRP